MKRNSKGFTLMEMLIVVAIIAVLAAISIPTFSGSLDKANQSADIANIRATYAEIVSANLLEGTAFPTTQADFVAEMDNGVKSSKGTLSYTCTNGEMTITYTVSGTEKLRLQATERGEN